MVLITPHLAASCLSRMGWGSCLALREQKFYSSTSSRACDSVVFAFLVVAQSIEAVGWRRGSGGVRRRRHCCNLWALQYSASIVVDRMTVALSQSLERRDSDHIVPFVFVHCLLWCCRTSCACGLTLMTRRFQGCAADEAKITWRFQAAAFETLGRALPLAKEHQSQQRFHLFLLHDRE